MYIRERSAKNFNQALVHLRGRTTNCHLMEGEAVHESDKISKCS